MNLKEKLKEMEKLGLVIDRVEVWEISKDKTRMKIGFKKEEK